MNQSTKMVCLGPAGSFSHQAALQFTQPGSIIVFADKNEDILPLITKNPEATGVIAVENTTAGFVLPVVRSWLEHYHANCSPIRACGELWLPIEHCLPINAHGELWLPIEHCLLVKPGTALEKIRTVLSHPQAIAQCQKFLGRLGKQTAEVSSTSFAAETIAGDQSGQTAAIASILAAKLYDLAIIERGIQDQENNKTHFLLLGRGQTAPTGNDRTVLMFRLKNEPGSLEKFLGSFSRRKINLSCIESIREGDGRAQLFYAEADCHADVDSDLRGELKANATELVIMGSFPKAM